MNVEAFVIGTLLSESEIVVKMLQALADLQHFHDDFTF